MSDPRTQRGFSVIEALVAAGLAGIALAGLASGAGLATQSLRLTRDVATGLALATDRLEELRLGPRRDGSDGWSAPDATRFARSWSAAGGRGRPVNLSVRVAWGRHALELRTEALP
jgi:Tfp pilus assembly protein PilV